MKITNVTLTHNGSQWVRLQIQKVVPKFVWRDWRPAGYTDDLGIIADRNQWVDEQLPGWYSTVDRNEWHEMLDWAEENLKGGFAAKSHYFILDSDADVAWFMLRWG